MRACAHEKRSCPIIYPLLGSPKMIPRDRLNRLLGVTTRYRHMPPPHLASTVASVSA